MCRYCEAGNPIAIDNKDQGRGIEIFADQAKICAYGYPLNNSAHNCVIADIDFCPKCGRKLR